MKFSIIFALVMGFFIHPAAAQQTWQSILESKFDIVETFDGLQDWTGKGTNGSMAGSGDLPVKMDGSKSFWDAYEFWGTSPSQAIWIGNHGTANVWQGTGKSLILDYTGDLGPGRLGFHIGSSPSDGYKNEVYVFQINKYPKNFFPLNGNQFLYLGYLKIFQISTGFRDMSNWGTVAQQQATANLPQTRTVYGLNYVIMDLYGDGGLFPQYNTRTALASSSGDNIGNQDYGWWTSADVSSAVLASEWFGIEYRFKKSNPPGTANGAVEAWVYRGDGTVIGHGLFDNVITFKNGSVPPYDHAYNKFVWGGNRYEPDFSGRTDGHASDPSAGHAYIDDIIVNGSRIGPTYFGLLTPSSPPSPPKNLRMR